MSPSIPKLPNILKPKPPKLTIPKVRDRFGTEVKQESARLTGVSRKLLGGYQESPARFLPKSRSLSLKKMMGGPKKPF
jgi:hypothetical protein